MKIKPIPKKDLETVIRLRKLQKYTDISKVYFKKAISYGEIIDKIEYKDLKITFKNRDRQNTERRSEGERRYDSIARTRQSLYRLISCNIGQHGDYPSIFFTITFKENLTDLKIANLEFKKFIMRLNYYFDKKLRYVFIPEFQKRGAVHYHGVFFNIPYIDKNKVQEIWGNGFTRIETTRKIKNISAYVAKYLSKETFDNRLFGQRILMTSRGLIRPVEIYGTYEVDTYIENVNIVDEVVIYTNNKTTLTKIKCTK